MRILPSFGRTSCLCLAIALFTGACLSSRLPKGSAAYVHVAGNGVVTFWGEPVALDELAAKLKKAGATRDTVIKLIPQGDVPDRLMRSIAGNIGRNGLTTVVIMEPRKAVVIANGTTVSEVVDEASEAKAPQ